MRRFKRILLLTLSVLCLSSCNAKKEYVMSEYEYTVYIIDEIICSLNERDTERLKKIFSPLATESINDFNKESDMLIDFVGSSIVSHEYDRCFASSMSVEDGEKSNMLRFSFNIITDENKEYTVFIICYNYDTANEDNVGVYMIEVANFDYNRYVGWQERMVPGISILKS